MFVNLNLMYELWYHQHKKCVYCVQVLVFYPVHSFKISGHRTDPCGTVGWVSVHL